MASVKVNELFISIVFHSSFIWRKSGWKMEHINITSFLNSTLSVSEIMLSKKGTSALELREKDPNIATRKLAICYFRRLLRNADTAAADDKLRKSFNPKLEPKSTTPTHLYINCKNIVNRTAAARQKTRRSLNKALLKVGESFESVEMKKPRDSVFFPKTGIRFCSLGFRSTVVRVNVKKPSKQYWTTKNALSQFLETVATEKKIKQHLPKKRENLNLEKRDK